MLLYCVTHMAVRPRRHGDGGNDGLVCSTPAKTPTFYDQHKNDPDIQDSLPIARVPPVRIEVPIREASNLRKRSQNILKDDEETDEESHHEWE